MQRANHICSFLNGENTTEIKSYKHDLLPSFAAGKDKDKVFWNAVIRQSLVAGLISKDIETYGVIKMTERGHDFIKKPHSFILVKEHDYSLDEDEGDIVSGFFMKSCPRSVILITP